HEPRFWHPGGHSMDWPPAPASSSPAAPSAPPARRAHPIPTGFPGIKHERRLEPGDPVQRARGLAEDVELAVLVLAEGGKERAAALEEELQLGAVVTDPQAPEVAAAVVGVEV